MKTIQILNPCDTLARVQKTDGYFFATPILHEYNNSVEYKNQKKMADYTIIKSTKEYIKYLKDVEKIASPLKSSNKGTWMHPKVFIDFCMWLSLEFKSKAIDWVLDGLIQTRNDAGDYYNELTATIMNRHINYYGCKPSPMVYINEAKLLKQITGIEERNDATEKQLSVLNTLQKIDIKLINDGVGKDSRHKQLKNLAEALL